MKDYSDGLQGLTSSLNKEIVTFKKRLVVRAKSKELGLDHLTEKEENQIQLVAEKSFQEMLYKLIESSEDYHNMSGEDKREKATEKLAAKGFTLESVFEEIRDSILSEKLCEFLTRDIIVTDDEVRNEYDKRVTAEKTEHEKSPKLASMNWMKKTEKGETTYYTPPCFRFVRMAKIRFEDADQKELDNNWETLRELQYRHSLESCEYEMLDEHLQMKLDGTLFDSDELEDLQAELAEKWRDLNEASRILAEAQEVRGKIYQEACRHIDGVVSKILKVEKEQGDWDSLIENDWGSFKKNVIIDKQGQPIYASTFASKLHNIGDIHVQHGSNGINIVKYVADVTEGPIELDAVKDRIKLDLLSTKRFELYDEKLNSWMEKAEFHAIFDEA